MRFELKSWEFLDTNNYLKEKLVYNFTQQNRLDLIFFGSWISKKEHNASFLRIRNFNFENIGKFLFVPMLTEHRDYKYIVAGSALRIMGTRDIYNLSCYINSGLTIYPTSNIANFLYFNWKKTGMKKYFNFNFQNLVNNNHIYDYFEIKECTFFLTYFEGLDKKAPVILKKKLESIYLNFILLRLLQLFNKLKTSNNVFNLLNNCNENFDSIDFNIDYYFSKLKSIWKIKNNKRRINTIKIKKGINIFFFSKFNLIERLFNYQINKCCIKFKVIKKKKYVKPRKKKLRLLKIDLPLITMKKQYIHPYRISKNSHRRSFRRLTVLGNKKLFVFNSRLSGFNNSNLTRSDLRNRNKWNRLVPLWISPLYFVVNKNDWSSSESVFINFFKKLIKTKKQTKELFKNKNNMVFKKAFSFFKRHFYKCFKFFWKPQVFLYKYKLKQWLNLEEFEKPFIFRSSRRFIDQNSGLDLIRWRLRENFYRKIFWNVEIFDNKISKISTFNKFKTKFDFLASLIDYGYGFWDWNFKTKNLGSGVNITLRNKYGFNFLSVFKAYSFRNLSNNYLKKLYFRFFGLMPFLQLSNKKWKKVIFWKRLFWLTKLWKLKKKKKGLNKKWFRINNRFLSKSFFSGLVNQNVYFEQFYKYGYNSPIFVNNLYESLIFQIKNRSFLKNFNMKKISLNFITLKKKGWNRFDKFYVRLRKRSLRSLTNKDEFYLVSLNLFYYYRFLNQLYVSFIFWLKNKANINVLKKKSHMRSNNSIINSTIYKIRRRGFFNSWSTYNLSKVKDTSRYLLTKVQVNKEQIMVSMLYRSLLYFINIFRIRNFWRFRLMFTILFNVIYKTFRRFFILNSLCDVIQKVTYFVKMFYSIKSFDFLFIDNLLSFSILKNYIIFLNSFGYIYTFMKVWPYNTNVSRNESIYINSLRRFSAKRLSLIPWKASYIYKIRKRFVCFSFEKHKFLDSGRRGLKFITRHLLFMNKKKKFIFLKSINLKLQNSFFYGTPNNITYKSLLLKGNIFYFRLFTSKITQLKKINNYKK